MRYVVFALIYIMIGIGVTAAAMERSGKQVADNNVNLLILTWPGTIAATAYMKWTEPKISCKRAPGGPM